MNYLHIFGEKIMSTKKYNENAIREAAYYCWQNAGCPWGNDEYFWNMAVNQLYGSCKTTSCCNSSKKSCSTKSKKSSSTKSSTTSSASSKKTYTSSTISKK